MNLKSGYPFWAVSNGLPCAFPPLKQDHECDVVVLGAGITGALIASELAAHGHSVCILDNRDAGWGSTAASTAMLQYEIDTHMVDLAKQFGEDDALLAYRSCVEAIDQLAELAHAAGNVGFARARSLYFASRKRDLRPLREEFELRARHGFDVRWLDGDEVEARYGFDAPAAILSGKAARVDPYRLAYRLLAKLQKAGVAVHDRSSLASIGADAKGVELRTMDGHRVSAGHLVMATGYQAQQFLRKRVARNRSSYAFVTDPIEPALLGPVRQTLIWETARPYLYMRTTSDNRLLVGGEDDAIDIPLRRDALVDRKAHKMAKRVSEMFPQLPVVPAFAWGGTFAETADGLPWFGAHPQHGPRVLFAMAYGGNGISYSMLGAGLLRATIEGRKHPLAALFGFERAKR